MRIVCIGGGPANLYTAILARQRFPHASVAVYERNRPNDTFGFGVVFSDLTLGNLATADPPSYAAIAARFKRWDALDITWKGTTIRGAGHGFCGLERVDLLGILHERARDVGVELHFESDVSVADMEGDLIVVGDGVASKSRTAHANAFGATVDERPNRFCWLAAPFALPAFWFLFRETSFGMLRVHAYPYKDSASTFIVECTDETWRRGGFAAEDEAHTIDVLSDVFADVLGGQRLVGNRSIWRRFPTVRCDTWVNGNRVLVGDAAHTAHYSIGSGTKLAMEDAIALVDALVRANGDVGQALISYDRARRDEVVSLQAAAQASLEWFEHTEDQRALSPELFAYHLLTRSLRVSHDSMRKRDSALAGRAEASYWEQLGQLPAARPADAWMQLPAFRVPRRLGGLAPGQGAFWLLGDQIVSHDGAAISLARFSRPMDAAWSAQHPGEAVWFDDRGGALHERVRWAEQAKRAGHPSGITLQNEAIVDMLLVSGRVDLAAV